MSTRVTVVDYGMGNLHSVRVALEAVGASVVTTGEPDEVRSADRLVLPGVGAFGQCVGGLRANGLDEALLEAIRRRGTPLLGICLGMQVLADVGEELGEHRGLGVMRGRIRHLDATARHGLPVPHVGWNDVTTHRPHPVLDVVAGRSMYFVHSYAFADMTPGDVLATTVYGDPVVAAVGHDSVVATQFHPEKSQAAGFELLDRFVRWTP